MPVWSWCPTCWKNGFRVAVDLGTRCDSCKATMREQDLKTWTQNPK